MKLESYGISDVGLRRSLNEDSFYRSDELGLFLVADGMGGHAAGEVASGFAITGIRDFLARFANDENMTLPFEYNGDLSRPANVLLNAIRLANQNLCHLQEEKPELAGMGTTVAALYIQQDVVILAHVGDSRIYRLRDGNLDQLTSDHSWVNEQLQKNIITADEARHHRYKNVITRALGNRAELEVDLRCEEAKPGDLFLLCSDGLSGMVEDDEIYAALSEEHSMRECANRLVGVANDAGGTDNITVVLVRCEGEDA